MLADRAVPSEPQPLVRRQGAVVEEPGRHRLGRLRIALDGPAAELRDQLQCPGQCSRGNPLASMSLADVTTANSPLRQRFPVLLVRRPALDPRDLFDRTELAPAQAGVPVEDE